MDVGLGCILIQEEEGRAALSGQWMDRVEVSTREGSYKGGQPNLLLMINFADKHPNMRCNSHV